MLEIPLPSSRYCFNLRRCQLWTEWDQMMGQNVAQNLQKVPKNWTQQVLFQKWCFQNITSQNIWVIFVRKFVAESIQKSSNLVTLDGVLQYSTFLSCCLRQGSDVTCGETEFLRHYKLLPFSIITNAASSRRLSVTRCIIFLSNILAFLKLWKFDQLPKRLNI